MPSPNDRGNRALLELGGQGGVRTAGNIRVAFFGFGLPVDVLARAPGAYWLCVHRTLHGPNVSIMLKMCSRAARDKEISPGGLCRWARTASFLENIVLPSLTEWGGHPWTHPPRAPETPTLLSDFYLRKIT